MAVIAQAALKGYTGSVDLATTTLSASDTLAYQAGANQVLLLQNVTASPVDVTIDGSTATVVPVPNAGITVDVSAGKVITVPANGVTTVELAKISAYLSGTVAVTGGVGVKAIVLIA